MSNFIYTKAKEALLKGQVNWLGDNIKVMLVTSAYTPTAASDEFTSIIPGGAIVAVSGLLAGKTVAGGVADASDTTVSAVSGSSGVQAYVLYADTGVSSSSRLIAYIDTATGLPISTLNGGDIVITWPSDANKILKV